MRNRARGVSYWLANVSSAAMSKYPVLGFGSCRLDLVAAAGLAFLLSDLMLRSRANPTGLFLRDLLALFAGL
jgi:hypothetical protein